VTYVYEELIMKAEEKKGYLDVYKGSAKKWAVLDDSFESSERYKA
jgi:hypothetical protein